MADIGSIRDYVDETVRYEMLGDRLMADSDTLILTGHNCGLKVVNDALHVRTGYKLAENREPLIYYRGAVPIHQIIILSRSGNISIDALYWCRDQGISVLLLDGMGNLVVSISPESEDSARLRRLQYRVTTTDMYGSIVRKLVQMKTVSQIATLKGMTDYQAGVEDYGDDDELFDLLPFLAPVRKPPGPPWEVLESGLIVLSTMNDIAKIRLLEAALARQYWYAFTGHAIAWISQERNKIPHSWRAITGRVNARSGSVGTSGRMLPHAVNPFHASLNYMYGVAEHWVRVAIYAAGLDPACGFFHADKKGRDSLVYDLIEPHRPVIDAKVLSFFDHTEMKLGDFMLLPSGQVMLNSEFSRYLILSCKVEELDYAGTVSWLKRQLTSLK